LDHAIYFFADFAESADQKPPIPFNKQFRPLRNLRHLRMNSKWSKKQRRILRKCPDEKCNLQL